MKGTSDPFYTFLEEVRELLDGLEQLLIHLETNPQDIESIHTAFRYIHTIKGSGAMFSLDPLVTFTHTVEHVFDRLREGSLVLTSELITLILQAKDTIEQLAVRSPSPHAIEESQKLIGMFAQFIVPSMRDTLEIQRADTSSELPDHNFQDSLTKTETVKTYRIVFHPNTDLFLTGTNPLFLLKELKDFGQHEILGLIHDIPNLEAINPEECNMSWEILLSTQKTIPEIQDIFLFVDDQGVLAIDVLDQPDILEQQVGYKRLGEILIERGIIQKKDLERAIGAKGYLGEILVRMGLVSQEDINTALEEQKFVRQVQAERVAQDTTSTIKVNTEKLNDLVNLVGEFVSFQARLGLTAEQKQDQEIRSLSEQLDTLVRQFRDLSISMHMVPIGLLFSSFRRLIRDVSQELGKQVDFDLEGSDTELDKTIIDLLKDPLLHLIRNSIDHGIELPEDRKSKGKSPQGILRLSANYAGTSVILTIFDDGNGIDVNKVFSKAVEKGLIDESDQLSQQEIQQLIFAPGFSTAQNTTNISGRGVGMDVVKKNIEQLHGSIKVESKEGAYTKISLRIPLTLAIVEGLLASIDGGIYLINLAFIKECLEYKDVKRLESGDVIDYRGSLVPLIPLGEQFRALKGIAKGQIGISTDGCIDEPFQDSPSATDKEDQQVLILSSDEQQVGIILDHLLDPYQSIVKSLGPLFQDVMGIGGAIILGDGTPALLIDADAYIQLAHGEVSQHISNCFQQKIRIQGKDESEIEISQKILGNMNNPREKLNLFKRLPESLFLIFKLGQEQFGIEIEKIEEVIEYSQVVFVPGSTKYLEGIINVRGRILPVLDLGGYLSVANYQYSITDSTRLIIVQSRFMGQDLSIALRVDQIFGIRTILNSQLEPMIRESKSMSTQVFWALATIPNSPITILLDVEALFT